MRIDLQHERTITLAEVPQHVPSRGAKKVHYSTIYRWVTKGARGQVLESVMVGGIRYTTVEAVQRFLSARPTTISENLASTNWHHAIEEELSRDGV